jgi:hypothetical protein
LIHFRCNPGSTGGLATPSGRDNYGNNINRLQ